VPLALARWWKKDVRYNSSEAQIVDVLQERQRTCQFVHYSGGAGTDQGENAIEKTKIAKGKNDQDAETRIH
jgi:hypothetical protein